MKKREDRIVYAPFELRAAADGQQSRAIGGIAALVETPTVLFESEWNGKKEKFIEVIKKGAFDDCLGDDVRALVNHNAEKVLGRTTAGTLKIYVTEDGHLGYDVPDVPNTTFGNDLLENVKRGEVNQSSFGFYVTEDIRTSQETEKEIIYTREIVKFEQLIDVSPVTFPAYESTITEMRSKMAEELRTIHGKHPEQDPNDDLAIMVEQQKNSKKLRLMELQCK